MEYMTANEAAMKWGLSSRRVHTLCGEGRIEGATRLGNAWAIPKLIHKCEKAQESVTQGTSQWTLLDRRITALRIASTLITKSMMEG